MSRLLLTAEVAERLRCSPAALHAARYRGQAPPALRRGRSLLWPEDELERWIAEQIRKAS